MLTTSLKQLVSRILEVEQSHHENDDESAMLSRNWEFVWDAFLSKATRDYRPRSHAPRHAGPRPYVQLRPETA